MSTQLANANGESDDTESTRSHSSSEKSLLVPFLIALLVLLLGLFGELVLEKLSIKNMVASWLDGDSPVRHLAEITEYALVALGFLAILAICALWMRWPVEAYNAVSTQIASALLLVDRTPDGLGRLTSRS